jgi:hypothetical protein
MDTTEGAITSHVRLSSDLGRTTLKDKSSGFFFVGLILLIFMIFGRIERELAFAQSTKQEGTKDNQEQKKPSFGFQEDDQNEMCLSATRQAKQLASLVDSYSRRLAVCATSNPNFRDDCFVDFGRLARSYNQYQVAISSVRNYCK